MRRIMSVLDRLLIISALAGTTLASMGGFATAGEAGRNCGTFYAQGDPSSGWGFTICVKLVHDPNEHTWWATASVTSTTPRISLFLSELEMRYATETWIDTVQLATVDGQGSSTFVTGSTSRPWCRGSVSLDATAKGFARWPNGVGSYVQAVRTTPVPVYGTC